MTETVPKTSTPPLVMVAITIIFALVGNAVYFAYQHGRLEQQVIDNRWDIERLEKRMESFSCKP